MIFDEFSEEKPDVAQVNTPPLTDTNDNSWKKEIGQACLRWINSIDNPSLLTDTLADEQPDLYTLFSAMGSLQTETRKLARKSVESLSSFEDTLSDINTRISTIQLLNQAQEPLRIISIVDRIERIEKQLKKVPPKKTFFNDARWTSYNQSVTRAVKLLLENCYDILKKMGVTKSVVCGKLFDPSHMVAIEVSYDEAVQDNIVTEEITPGYFYNGTVLRYSDVNVNRKKS
ncbi:MAG TPA: nucleotide exchange factor GrpE [Chitinispirillaceae bacterium]|nr:nucleotide exchange factor GrpE [Chitinispirillaceae bacterium]